MVQKLLFLIIPVDSWCKRMPKPIRVDKTPDVPKAGDRMPVERFHISKLNVRANRPFGESEKDKSLLENVRRNGIVEPMLARPEGNGFGIYAGERKYHSAMIIGYKAFVIGEDALIRNVTDEQARLQSLIEDLDALREELNPIERANAIMDVIRTDMIGERAVAKRLGVAPSTLSQWIKILDLTPPMRDAVAKGQIYFKDALNLAKAKVGEIQEKKLAEAAETGGRDGYMATLEAVQAGHEKRGLPAGMYNAVKMMFNMSHKDEESQYKNIEQQAQVRNMETGEYSKQVMTNKKALLEYAKSLS